MRTSSGRGRCRRFFQEIYAETCGRTGRGENRFRREEGESRRARGSTERMKATSTCSVFGRRPGTIPAPAGPPPAIGLAPWARMPRIWAVRIGVARSGTGRGAAGEGRGDLRIGPSSRSVGTDDDAGGSVTLPAAMQPVAGLPRGRQVVQTGATCMNDTPNTPPTSGDRPMHVLFVHQNFPAQFGHIAGHLVQRHGLPLHVRLGEAAGPRRRRRAHPVPARGRGHRARPTTARRTFENAVWHAHGVYEALKARPDVQPDLIVGHSGFGSTLFLRELYDCPIINYFEYFYRAARLATWTSAPTSRRRARPPPRRGPQRDDPARPGELRRRLQPDRAGSATGSRRRTATRSAVIFDGIDTDVWRPHAGPAAPGRRPRRSPTDVQVVTYVARGMESMRGFDIFMKVAKKLCDRRDGRGLRRRRRRTASATAATSRSPAGRRSRSGCWRRTTTTCRGSSSSACCRRRSWRSCSRSATCTST